MNSSPNCPGIESLKGLLDGTLPSNDQATLNTHLESCEVCQRTLEGLVAGRESWSGVADQLAGANATSKHGEALAAVMENAKRGAADANTAPGRVQDSPVSLDFLKPSSQPGYLGRLGSYEVIEVVGRGGFGIVLKALDTSLRRVVAVKVLSEHLASCPTARRRFVREAQAAAAVIHDHVVAIHAVEDSHEPPFFVMQFVDGKTLQQRIDGTRPLSINEILRIGMQAAAGLAAAHAQGLVHRDVKPANILLENGVERVKITDFGLARAADDASMTQSGVVAGTPQFMSPEQAAGDSVDARADLFSLGSVMYTMCTGRPPFRASTTMGVLKRVCEERPRPVREINPEIPEWLDAIVHRLLAKEPSQRFQNAHEVADLLGQHLAHRQHPELHKPPAPVATGPEPATVAAAAAELRAPDSVASAPHASASTPAAAPSSLLEHLVRLGLGLMAVGGLVQVVIWLFILLRGSAVSWAIGGVAVGAAMVVLAAIGHFSKTHGWRWAAPVLCIALVATFAYFLLRPRLVAKPEPVDRASDAGAQKPPAVDSGDEHGDSGEKAAANGAEVPEAIDRLVQLAERDLERVRKRIEAKVAPVRMGEEAELGLIAAKLERAKFRQDQAEVVDLWRQAVKIHETDQARVEQLVSRGFAAAADLARAEKVTLEAKLQLSKAELALEKFPAAPKSDK
jgi:serine/threonine protein kinase